MAAGGAAPTAGVTAGMAAADSGVATAARSGCWVACPVMASGSGPGNGNRRRRCQRLGCGTGSGPRQRLEPGVALLLELERQLLAARADDAAVHQHVHAVGNDVVQEALVVGDQQEGPVGLAQPLDPRRA